MAAVSRTSSNASSGGPPSPLIGSVYEQLPPLPPNLARLVSLAHTIAYWSVLLLDRYLTRVWEIFSLFLAFAGLREPTAENPRRRRSREAGEGLAVVIVGAKEDIGQMLTLRLAQEGYTVFPLLPQPSAYSPPTSQALASLLLTWGDIQKRLRSVRPRHPGQVIPVLTDPEPKDYATSLKPALKVTGKLEHAGDTVRAYCRDNHLVLVGIICAPRTDVPKPGGRAASMSSTGTAPEGLGLDVDLGAPTQDTEEPIEEKDSGPPTPTKSPRSISSNASVGSLILAEDHTLFSLYKTNVVDPLTIIRDLGDLLGKTRRYGRGNGKVIFINDASGAGLRTMGSETQGQALIVGAARRGVIRQLRSELRQRGLVDVCEVAAGATLPLKRSRKGSISFPKPPSRLPTVRSPRSEAASLSVADFQGLLTRKERLAQIFTLPERIFAIDDRLVFRVVNNALLTPAPRGKIWAGYQPMLKGIGENVPFVGGVGRLVALAVRRGLEVAL